MLLKPSEFGLASSAPVAPPVEGNVRSRMGAVREHSQSDEQITVESAVAVSAVIAIIGLISQDMASLPLILYGRQGNDRFRNIEHSSYGLMHDAPNPEHTSYQFREFVTGHVIAWGNFFAQQISDRSGIVRELWPLRPDRMTVMRVKGEKLYLYITPEGKQRVFFKDEILHVAGFGFDGLVGMSKVALARNAIGLAMSQEKYGSKFYANDTTLGVVFTSPNALSDTAYERLDKALNDEHKGVENAHNKIILEEGLTVDRLGVPMADVQFLETRKFQLDEINRIVGPVPPHMYGDTVKTTSWGTGIDSQEQGYVNHTLRSHAVRIEQALQQQLLLDKDRQAGLYFEHLFDSLLRGDLAARTTAYMKMLNNSVYTPNDVLAKENMNGYPEGNVHYRPTNVVQIEGGPSVAAGVKPGAKPGAGSSLLQPVWQDASQRVATREANDVRGAARRFLAKGQIDQFNAWCDQFYSNDHLAFAKKQYGPVMGAMKDLHSVDCGEVLEQYLTACLIERRSALEGLTADQVEELADTWQKDLPGQMTGRIVDQLKELAYETYLAK
jgi:HK97 family phage portal protein